MTTRARAHLEPLDRKPWRQDRGCAQEARSSPVRWPAVTTLRAVAGIVCGVAAAALGALILGEYEFRGTLPFVAGPLFGLVIGEVVVSIGRVRTVVAGAIASAAAFGGIVWAGWIDSSEGVEPVKALVWVAAPLAAATALVRIAGLPGRAR
jgi:hypothetical protein